MEVGEEYPQAHPEIASGINAIPPKRPADTCTVGIVKNRGL